MIYDVRHHTGMVYASPVADARFNLRLLPHERPGQTILSSILTLDPVPARREEIEGPYCVRTTRVEYAGELAQLDIVSEMRVEVLPPAAPGAGPPASEVRDAAITTRDLSPLSPAPYLFASRIAGMVAEIGEWAAAQVDMRAGIVEAATALNRAVHREFAYTPGVTDSSTLPAEAFGAKQGVCQDYAHVMIIGLRWLGLPAAYASGYLRTVPPPGQEKLVGADGMHAWVDVWCGGELGWIGMDPTNDRPAGEDHVQIARGRDYADVAPVDGIFLGAAPQTMTAAVDVTEVEQAASPNGPGS